MSNNFGKQGGKKHAYDDSVARSAQGLNRNRHKKQKHKKSHDEELLKEIHQSLAEEDDNPWQQENMTLEGDLYRLEQEVAALEEQVGAQDQSDPEGYGSRARRKLFIQQ